MVGPLNQKILHKLLRNNSVIFEIIVIFHIKSKKMQET